MARFDRFFDAVHDLGLIAYIGPALAIVGVIISPIRRVNWLVGVGFVLVGVVLTILALEISRRRRFRMRWLECLKTYEISGPRGNHTVAIETVTLCATTDLDSFPFSIFSGDGVLERDVLKYRNLGRRGKLSGSQFFTLGPGNLSHQPSGGEGTTLRILPPAPVKKLDFLQLERRREVRDCFPRDEEALRKRVLFPIKKLEFLVTFDGCPIENAGGTKYNSGVPVGFSALQIENKLGNICVVKWSIKEARPGEMYAIDWKWV